MNSFIERIMDTIRELQQFGEIITGTSEELKIVNYIIERFRDMGIDASKMPVKVMSWQPNEATIIVGEKTINATLQPYSPSFSVDGRLVYIKNLRHDLEKINPYESIALIELSTVLDDYELQYHKLIEAGSLAIIFYDPYPERKRRLVATGSLNYSFTPGVPLPIPILHVTRNEGLELLRYEGRRIFIKTRSYISDNATGYNIIATIYGRSDKRIILSAHHDHWLTGVSDNIIGVAMILELARYIIADEMRHTLQVISFTAEESGALGFAPWYWAHGSRVFVREQEELETLNNIVAVINIDAVARGVLNINATGIEYQALLKSIAAKLGIDYRLGFDHPYYDSFSFSMKGIPAVTLNTLDSISDIYHTDRDTIEILELNTIKSTFILALETLKRLLKSNNPFKEYGYLTYALKIHNELENTPIQLKIHGYRLLEATRKALAENMYEKLFNAYKELNKELIKPLFRGKYDEDSGGFETVLLPHLEVLNDMKNIRRAIMLLKEKRLSEALKILEQIPPQRIIPGEEKVISESLSRMLYSMLLINPSISDSIIILLENELKSLSASVDIAIDNIVNVLNRVTNMLIA